MELMKNCYVSPELKELNLNAFAVIAGASPKTDQVPGDVAEGDLK